MIRLLSFIFLISCAYFIKAQEIDRKKVDSLEALLRRLPENQARFDVLIALNDIFYYSDYKRCIKYMEQADAIANKIQYWDGRSYALSEQATLQSNLGNNVLAIELLHKSIHFAVMGKDTISLAQAYNNMGYMHKLTGNIDSTLYYYKKSLFLKEKKGNLKTLAYAYLNIGYVYHQHVNAQTGVSYYRKALHLAYQTRDSFLIGSALNNIGFVHKEQNAFDSAIIYFEKARAMAIRLHDKSQEGKILNNLSSIEEKKGNLSKAEEYLQLSLKINREIQNLENISVCLQRLAQIYYDKKNYNKAIEYGKESLKITLEHQLTESSKANYHTLAYSYNRNGNYKEAFLHLNRYLILHDSINNERTTKLIADNEAQYQNEKKQLMIKSLETENDLQEVLIHRQEQQRMYLIIGLAMMLLIAVLFYRSYRIKKRDNLIIAKQKTEVEEQKRLITEQRDLVEEKNKEITDSIRYAKRIQNTHLPSEIYILRALKRLRS